MAALSWLIVFLMLLTDDLSLMGHTKYHARRPVASAVRVGREVPATSENLVKAAEEGDLRTVKNLIARDVDSGTALSRAASGGHFEIVKALLEAGAYPDGAAANSTTDTKPGWPLFWAAANNHADIVDLLLEAGADVNAHPAPGGTIRDAARNGHLEMVKRLLEAGFVPNNDEDFGLLKAIENGYLEIVKAFIDAGIDVNARHGLIITAAALSRNVDILKAVLGAGARRKYYGAILNHVAKSGNTDVLKTLLEAGGKITYGTRRDPDGSPLHTAATEGHIDVIELLVEYGADINAPFASNFWHDSYGDLGHHGKGWTVMHIAARWGYQPILQKLMDLGADVSAVDNKGYTPLHVAVIYLKLDVVDELLRLCADPNLPNKNGETAADLAQKMVSKDLSDLLQPSRMLKDLATDLLKLKISYYHYTEKFTEELAREVQATINSDETMYKLLEEQTPQANWTYIKEAVRRVFDDKAISGLLKVFKAHDCKVGLGTLEAPIGIQYSFKCECIPAKGRKLIIKHIPNGSECVSAKTVQN